LNGAILGAFRIAHRDKFVTINCKGELNFKKKQTNNSVILIYVKLHFFAIQSIIFGVLPKWWRVPLVSWTKTAYGGNWKSVPIVVYKSIKNILKFMRKLRDGRILGKMRRSAHDDKWLNLTSKEEWTLSFQPSIAVSHLADIQTYLNIRPISKWNRTK
jgi:hypothetical protein